MNGLLAWSHSRCRSTLAFYEGLARAFNVPFRVLCLFGGKSRLASGYTLSEFDHLDLRIIGEDRIAAIQEYEKHRSWHHLFGAYQKGNMFREMLLRIAHDGGRVAVASEAPCIMNKPPISFVKNMYIRSCLRMSVRKQVSASDFIINLSGEGDRELMSIGWPQQKIIACGYYPPPLVGSSVSNRGKVKPSEFCLLMTGAHEWHRNPMVLLKALAQLKARGIVPKTVITQAGSITEKMKNFARQHALNVEFAGVVPIEHLIHLYETCSCFIATGRAEPWGIRVNDALNCGAPIIVSTGMGAVKLVNDRRCGLAFKNNDEIDLTNKLGTLITDERLYREIAQNAYCARAEISPDKMAIQMADDIRNRFDTWA